MMIDRKYVHGYHPGESSRLQEQASALADLIHEGTTFPDGSLVLEAGCGVGSQTIILAGRSPGAHFVAVDTNRDSLDRAAETLSGLRYHNVTTRRCDIMDMPFEDDLFDHVFVCFLLEHLENPLGGLASLKRVLKPEGTITVIEGDHGSAFFFPKSEAAQRTIDSLVEVQRRLGGNALIGRELYPLLVAAGFDDVRVSPRVVYADQQKRDLVEGFVLNTFTAMVNGARDQVLEMGLMDEKTWTRGIEDLCKTANVGGTFSYTFFKGQGLKREGM